MGGGSFPSDGFVGEAPIRQPVAFRLDAGRQSYAETVPVIVRRLKTEQFLRFSLQFGPLNGRGVQCQLNFFLRPEEELSAETVFQTVNVGSLPRPNVYLQSEGGQSLLTGRVQTLLPAAAVA